RQRPVLKGSLGELYEMRRAQLLAEPKRLLFEADILQWLGRTCAAGLSGLQIAGGSARVFTISWGMEGQTTLFRFESGSNWKRWLSIARNARSRQAQNAALKAVLFRGVEQPPIPGPAWVSGPEIEEAKRECLHLIALTPDDFAALYAGYDLYA